VDNKATSKDLELHKGKGSTLRTEQVATILQLHKLKKTQAEIAQAIGCDQATVSRWLTRLTDSTEVAGAYLRGSALQMAKNVVKAGQARDHIAALKGIGVLKEDETGHGLVIQIGIKDSDVTFACSTQQVASETHSLSVDTESDN
jgi:hypothetical protein